MKNYFSAALLTFLMLSSAFGQVPSKQKTNENTQLLSALERSCVILYRNNSIFLGNLNEITTAQKNYSPLADIANKINAKAEDFNQDIANAMQNANAKKIDYRALFGKYSALCELTKSEFLTLQQDAQAGKITGVVISPESLNSFFSNSPLVGKAQTALSKADFDKLEGDNLKAYLTGLNLDVISGTNEVILFLRDKIKSPELQSPLSYNIMSASPKPNILLGEEYKAEISISPYYSSLPQFSITVNNATLPVQDGKAVYTSRPNKLGTQSYTVNTNITDPLTGEVTKTSKEYFYEVTAPMVYIETANSHVLYVGQDNIINVFASGISNSDISISASGTAALSLAPNSRNSYIVRVAQQGTANIAVTNRSTGKTIGLYTFTVK